MTEESLIKGQKIRQRIKQIEEIKSSITPYLRERVELEVTYKKGLMSYNADEDSKHQYTLYSDSPLFIAIASCLSDMITDLQRQFDELDSCSQQSSTNDSSDNNEPLAKTSWWRKVWGRK